MRWKNRGFWKKTYKNICSVFLTLVLLLQTGLTVTAGANEVVKDSGGEDCVDIQLPVEKQQQFVSKDEVISVSMPLQTPFTMNPTKSFGEEQIWSPVFHFQNNSRMAVEVTIKNIRYILKENSTVVTHYQPFDGLEEREGKEIYLFLRFGEAEVPVGDLSREYCFTLAGAGDGASSRQEFSIEGMMSCYPEQEWQDGDVAIAFQVEYRAVSEIQVAAGGNAAGEVTKTSGSEKNQTFSENQESLEKSGISLMEVKDPEWQKDLIGVVLSANTNGTKEGEATDKVQTDTDVKAHIRAYITDSGGSEQEAAVGEEQSDAEAEFPFDWKKILDDYEKYAEAIPDGAVLLLDANGNADNPAAYVTEEGLKGLALDMENTGVVYAFWRNPDYVPDENKVWHIEDDVPYYISNPEQPWLWSEADGDVPSDADPVFLWIPDDHRAQSKADASQQTYQDIQKKEGNTEYGPGNNTGGTAAE